MKTKTSLLLSLALGILIYPITSQGEPTILKTGGNEQVEGILKYVEKAETPYFVITLPIPIRALSQKEEPIVTRSIQLVDLNEENWKIAIQNQGKKVSAKGRMLEDHNALHHRPLLLFVTTLEPKK